MSISIVIPTYNRFFTITRVLDSLMRQTCKDFELIIVDDGSTDKTKETVKPYVGETVKYVRTPHRGTPYAWNLGVRLARQEYVFLVGDDVVLDTNCIKVLVSSLTDVRSGKLGAIAPRLVYTLDVYGGAMENDKFYAHIEPWSGNVAGSFDVDAKGLVRVEVVHGYSVVSKEAFLDVGGFDEQTYTGNYWREETDLWLRFRHKGYKLYYEPRAKIYCEKSLKKGGQWSNVEEKRLLYEYYVVRNHSNFLKKFYGRQSFFMLPAFILRRMYIGLLQMHAYVQHR